MGLDMYLYEKEHLSSYSDGDRFKNVVDAVNKSTAESDLTPLGLPCYITYEVAYWRKANAVHRWFVDHVQGGVDDCKEYTVYLDQLKTLRDICKDLLVEKDSDRAFRVLPPQAGYFFGSEGIDDWYWNDLEQTVKQLTKIIDSEHVHATYKYQASW